MIRKGTAQDVKVIAELLDTFNREFDTPTPGTDVLRERVGELVDDEHAVFLLSGEPAIALALITLRPSVWYSGAVATLDELYVAPEYRSQGIGSALLGSAEEMLRAMNVGALADVLLLQRV
jgi:ribosomal protein S18 acetylase RimI-like enzyme